MNPLFTGKLTNIYAKYATLPNVKSNVFEIAQTSGLKSNEI